MYSLYNSVHFQSPQNNSTHPLMSKPLISENIQIGPKVSIFCVATIIFQHCLNPLGHGVHQSFTGSHWSTLPLLHDDITELVDVRDLALLHLPFENAPQITFTLSFFSKAVSDGRGSCSASVCHRMFFGRPWRGLFLVEPVLLNRCLDHRAAVSGFWQSSYSLRHLYVEQQLFFFRSSESS